MTVPDCSALRWAEPAEQVPFRVAIAAALESVPTSLVEVCDVETARTNNAVRAGRAARALVTYSNTVSDLDDGDHEQFVCGLLTDLRHLCDALGVDFDRASSDVAYQYEVRGGD